MDIGLCTVESLSLLVSSDWATYLAVFLISVKHSHYDSQTNVAGNILGR